MDAIIAAPARTSLPRSFDWAEPLICDQVLSIYGQVNDEAGTRLKVAAAHTRMWLSLVEGDGDLFEARRGELLRLAQDAKIKGTEIDRANRAVLLELVLVVVTRFRNSDRVRLSYVERLQSALRVIKANPSHTLH